MTLTVLFAGPDSDWPDYSAPLPAALDAAGIDHVVTRDARAEDVDYIVYAPDGPIKDFCPFQRAKAVLSLWAGVESIVTNTTLTQPLYRMVDEGLERGMVEWVTGHVLRHHLGLDAHVQGQDGVWRGGIAPPLAAERVVGILGLGALGAACGQALSTLGFPVCGWSRRKKQIAGLECHAGPDGLNAVLAKAQILVLLLPLTPDTTGVMSAEHLALMPRGSVLINPGRGPLIDDPALLAVLDNGHIAHATLDVFATEPLPADHPYWAHPKVTVTPHIASTTRPKTAALSIAATIKGHEAGQILPHLVDRRGGLSGSLPGATGVNDGSGTSGS